ncbi:MAG: adenylate/guanylate cyclase domain-containing protein [Actinomycetota bacterium]
MADSSSTLEGAREAAGRYAWAEAFELFGSADATSPLGPDDLFAMSESAWWVGKMRHCIALRERAYAGYLKAGNNLRAARTAIELGVSHDDLMEESVSTAWIQRAAKLLESEPEGAEHGWLTFTYALATRGQWEKCGELAAKAGEIAARHKDKDLFALSLSMRGLSLVFSDEIDRGMALVEEATVGAVSGELGPYATGWIFCMMISGASHLADWQRAGQWTEAAKRWCDRQAINGFPGVCRVHRAEIMRLRGALTTAEEEARVATEELASFNTFMAALAFKELGEVRLRMGEIDGAEEAFRQANEMGVVPQPGLALVQLLRGKPEAAAKALARALAEEGMAPLDRAKLLPTQAEVALILGDIETAREAAAGLKEVAASYKAPALRAAAEASDAAVRLADGELDAAEEAAKRAARLFKEADLLYDVARTSQLLGQIYQAQGDGDAAQFEVSSALSTFERIGALPDADRARSLLAAATAEPSAPKEHRVAKTFLFSDIVRSTNLLDAIGDEAWGDLLKWHDDVLRKLFAEHGGEEVAHTGDGFFVAFANADDAVACAIAVQRSLVEHRRAHGFSPQVRVGVHATEAAEVKGNYHGKGVHEAARIGALADAGEIVISSSSLECIKSSVETTDARQVSLKGVAEPVTVASVVWRA